MNVPEAERQVEVHTDPGPAGYSKRQGFATGDQVFVVIVGRASGHIAVVDIRP